MRKKKKQAACTAEMAELVLVKYTDKVGSNKRSWQLQVRSRPADSLACTNSLSALPSQA